MPIACIEDLREAARRRLPRAVFDFVDGGAQDEITLRANRADFARLTFMPRVLTDVSKRSLGTDAARPAHRPAAGGGAHRAGRAGWHAEARRPRRAPRNGREFRTA